MQLNATRNQVNTKKCNIGVFFSLFGVSLSNNVVLESNVELQIILVVALVFAVRAMEGLLSGVDDVVPLKLVLAVELL